MLKKQKEFLSVATLTMIKTEQFFADQVFFQGILYLNKIVYGIG